MVKYTQVNSKGKYSENPLGVMSMPLISNVRVSTDGKGQVVFVTTDAIGILAPGVTEAVSTVPLLPPFTQAAALLLPSAAKVWALLTTPSTVTASYPTGGVALVNNSAGNYTYTHGVTFNSTNYVVIMTPIAVGGGSVQCHVISQTATTVTYETDNAAGTVANASVNLVCYGTLA